MYKRTILIFAISLFACAPAVEHYPTLANQGLLPLSTSNAYVGANLFLAKEFSQSQYLFNFLKGRGAPTAIEIETENFKAAPRMIMYYPRDKEVYSADLMQGEMEHEWVIRGPYRMERKDYKSLAETEASLVGEPLFDYNGRQFRFRFQRMEDPGTVVPIVPTPAPTPKPIKKKIPKVITKPEDVGAQKKLETWKPLNTDQQAIMMSQGFAERASNGDVIHTVVGEETIEKIAEWYTGSAANAKEIATANSMAEGIKPAAGQRIQIPLRLVKEFKALK